MAPRLKLFKFAEGPIRAASWPRPYVVQHMKEIAVISLGTPNPPRIRINGSLLKNLSTSSRIWDLLSTRRNQITNWKAFDQLRTMRSQVWNNHHVTIK